MIKIDDVENFVYVLMLILFFGIIFIIGACLGEVNRQKPEQQIYEIE